MKKLKPAPFKFKPFSKKQLQILTWWKKHPDKDGIICDGSVRAGKTIVMSLSFVIWATDTFNDESFGLAGKTIGSLRRNVVKPLKRMLQARKYYVKEHRAENMLEIRFKGHTNFFYLFGGKDEGSQDLIQGITLAGMFFDEVALMPQSFVNQATARCSVEGSKLWFNCNPNGPYHWFKVEYLNQLEEKNMLHIHFTMDDNLSLSEKVKERYKRMYSGIFYQRYILGLWVLAEGIIYDMFREEEHVVNELKQYDYYYVSCDYGTQNPTCFIMFGVNGEEATSIKEYYYDGRASSVQKTDSQYCDDLTKFIEGYSCTHMWVDPSAASFIAEIKQRNIITVHKANNDVLNGIRFVSQRLKNKLLFIHSSCKNTIKEFMSYVWDEKAVNRGEDKPLKVNDHAMDSIRYGIYNEFGLKQKIITSNPVVTSYEDIMSSSYDIF
jgi:PBSX family phage terminase large subunit